MIKLTVIQTDRQSKLAINIHTQEMMTTGNENPSDVVWRNRTIAMEVNGYAIDPYISRVITNDIITSMSNCRRADAYIQNISRIEAHVNNAIKDKDEFIRMGGDKLVDMSADEFYNTYSPYIKQACKDILGK